jgi:FSR family fosmidomycin resistance protein-like MFS transporter
VTLAGAAWLGGVHLMVDAACVASVLRSCPPGDAMVSSALAFVLGYDLLAFAGQAPCGWLVDRLGVRRGATLAGLALTALALVAGARAGGVTVGLAGLGNALFHVGAGAMVLAGSQGRAAPAGVFVAPGALGLGIGIVLGRRWLTAPLWPLLPVLAVACGVVLLLVRVRASGRISAATVSPDVQGRRRIVIVVMALLAFSVAIRALVGTVGCDDCPRGWLLMAGIPAVAFLGKLSGGFLADRFGWIDVSVVALLVSGPLLAFADGDRAVVLLGMLVFQMTMPVTLAAALRALPDWPGLGFGILCVALFGGALPAYLPGGWRPHGVSLLVLVLAAAGALYAALHMLRLRTLADPLPEASATPSTLCKGTP